MTPLRTMLLCCIYRGAEFEFDALKGAIVPVIFGMVISSLERDGWIVKCQSSNGYMLTDEGEELVSTMITHANFFIKSKPKV